MGAPIQDKSRLGKSEMSAVTSRFDDHNPLVTANELEYFSRLTDQTLAALTLAFLLP